MSDKKLLIILIIVIIIQCVMTLTHPAYRYYKIQSEQLREDYIRFEKKVREDFVPAITNMVNYVPRGTLQGIAETSGLNNAATPPQAHCESQSTIGNPMRCEKDATALEKRTQSISRDVEGTVGCMDGEYIAYVNGHILHVGDLLYGYPIQSIDPCAIDIGCAIISVKPISEKEVKDEKTLETITVPYCADNYGVYVW